MKKRLIQITIFSLLMFGAINMVDVNAQILTSRATNRQVQNLLVRIETKTDTFSNEIDRVLDRSRIDGTNRENNIVGFINEFENATDSLRRSFNARQNVNTEVSEVLNRGVVIDRFMATNRLGVSAESQWRSLKTDLNTLASYYSINWNWNQNQYPGTLPGTPAYYVSEGQVRSLLTRIETRTDSYKRQIDSVLDRRRWENTNRGESLSQFVEQFELATDRLKQKFDNRQSIGSDVSDVLMRAAYIDQFMARTRLSNASQSQWRNLKNDLNTLGSYYRVSWNWNQTLPPFAAYDPVITTPGGNLPGRRFDARLTGTYRLNTTQSDNVSDVIGRSLGYYTAGQRDNVRRNLERRLMSPEMIAIEKVGRTVTIASSNAPQVTFDADGVAKTETNARGRVITTTATVDRQDGFSINYQGERANDFYVSFVPDRNGQLRVTRRVYLENRSDQITVSSLYDKTDNTAIWSNVYTGPDYNAGTGIGTGVVGNFIIPNGTQITAFLRNTINTRESQVNDRFTMEVTSPSQYRGAIIEGRVMEADRSGRFSGRANVSLDLETIRMTNGQSYRFAGIIENVTAANGDDVSVNNEGVVRDGNQTTKTVTRAGIGAVLGALIGAIAGGGSGAAIGAAVGAGAGAGTVLVQGRDTIELGQGSQFRITATAPANLGYNRQ